jgi:hypothetical protein
LLQVQHSCCLHMSSSGGQGFGKVDKPKAAPPKNAGNPANRRLDSANKGDLMKRMAQRFIALKNEGNVDTVIKLCAKDVDVYGTLGLEAAEPVLRAFFESHPQLHHELKPDDGVALLGSGKVGYRFTKTWLDPATQEQQQWVSFDEERNKMETLEFYADGRIKRMAIEKYDSWPPEGATILK